MESRTSGRTLVLVGVFLAIALMLALPVRSWLSQRTELAELQGQIDEAKARVTSLQAQQSQWQDPLFIESQARVRLNMVRPGENGLIVMEQGSPEQSADEGPPTTWYDKLWRSADSAAGRRPTEMTGGNGQDAPDGGH